jgi:hypothetical protein
VTTSFALFHIWTIPRGADLAPVFMLSDLSNVSVDAVDARPVQRDATAAEIGERA